MKRFSICTSNDPEELEKEVTELLNDYWMLCGSLVVSIIPENENIIYSQTLHKNSRKE